MPEPERSIEELVEEVRGRWDQATSGPWAAYFDMGGTEEWLVHQNDDGLEPIARFPKDWASEEQTWLDANAIAHAPEDIATLLRAVARLREDLNGSRHIHGLTLGVQRRLREENERLRKYATHLPGCHTRHPRPADAPENQCSCGFAALAPKGGDHE